MFESIALEEVIAGQLAPGDNYTERLEESHEDYLLRAAEEGLVLVLPLANQLQLDIDTEETYWHFLAAYEILKREVAVEYTHTALEMIETRSKSGNRHITITLPFNLDSWQRIAWQGALGSDRFRELYSCIRTLRKHPHPTIFAEKK